MIQPSPIFTRFEIITEGSINVANLTLDILFILLTIFFLTFEFPIATTTYPSIVFKSSIVPTTGYSSIIVFCMDLLSSINPFIFHSKFALFILWISHKTSRPNPPAPTIYISFTIYTSV